MQTTSAYIVRPEIATVVSSVRGLLNGIDTGAARPLANVNNVDPTKTRVFEVLTRPCTTVARSATA